jgi:hypothetical protein
MTTSKKHLSKITNITFIGLLLLSLSSCWLDTEGTKEPDNCQGDTSGIMFRLTVNGPNTVANEPYQTSVTWQAESLAPDEQNTCGNTDPINITKTYSGNRNVSGDYTIEQPATQERPGLWKFTVNALGSSSTCNKTLTPGNTKLVGFTHQQAGCQ